MPARKKLSEEALNALWSQPLFEKEKKKVSKPAPEVKESKPTRTDETIAQIEEFLDDGEEIYVAQMVARLGLDRNFLSAVFGKMIRQKIITPMGKRYVDGVWHMFYQSYDKKPKQASMFSSVPLVRDALVSALFGNENRDSEAAWVF